MSEQQLATTKKWYVVNTYVGHENKVRDNLLRRIDTMNLHDTLFHVVVAEKKEFIYKEKKSAVEIKEITTNLYPGYLFVEMIMTDEAWYVVRNTPGVTGFIGSSGGGTKPFPMSQEEVDGILKMLEENKNLKPLNEFEKGDKVKILNNTLKNRIGIVESIDKDQQKAKISLEGFENVKSLEISLDELIRYEEQDS